MADNNQEIKIQLSLSKLQVLLVDDSLFDRELAVASLKKIGITKVQVAENGTIAINKIQNALEMRTPYDLIFLDSRMPAQDGVSVLSWMRKDHRLHHQPVIITTGTLQIEDVREFIDLGAKGFVVKPVTLDVLRSKILEALHLGQTRAG